MEYLNYILIGLCALVAFFAMTEMRTGAKADASLDKTVSRLAELFKVVKIDLDSIKSKNAAIDEYLRRTMDEFDSLKKRVEWSEAKLSAMQTRKADAPIKVDPVKVTLVNQRSATQKVIKKTKERLRK